MSEMVTMEMQSIFLTCSICQKSIRQLVKDMEMIRTRICPGCGSSIAVNEKADNSSVS